MIRLTPLPFSGTVIKSLKEVDSLSIQRVMTNPTMQGIIRSQHLVAESIGKKTLGHDHSMGAAILRGENFRAGGGVDRHH